MADSMFGKIEVLIQQQVCLYNGGYYFVSVDSLSDYFAVFSNIPKLRSKVNKTGCRCHKCLSLTSSMLEPEIISAAGGFRLRVELLP